MSYDHSKVPIVADGRDHTVYKDWSLYMDAGLLDNASRKNHRGAVNLLFVDGHAASLKPGDRNDLYFLEPGTNGYAGTLRGW